VSQPERTSVLSVLASLAVADRESWSLLTGHRDLEEVSERLRRVTLMPKLPDVRHLVPAGRVPLVVAHGPGFEAALPAIAANRNRLWVMAPFRSAVCLVKSDLVPDVIVLADRDTWPIAASLEQWRTMPADQSRRLTTATLVVDVFAPAELVDRFTRACTFDSGLGCGTALPLHGSAVLAAVSLAFVLGHRHVGIAGVDLNPATRLGGLLAQIADAEDAQCCDVASCGVAGCLERGPSLVALSPALRTSLSPSHPVCARATASRELETLAGLLREVEAGLMYTPTDERLTGLVHRVRSRWRQDPTVVAAVERADLRWLLALWELEALGIQPRDAGRSNEMVGRLVLTELARALEQHLDDCRACLDRHLGKVEAVA